MVLDSDAQANQRDEHATLRQTVTVEAPASIDQATPGQCAPLQDGVIPVSGSALNSAALIRHTAEVDFDLALQRQPSVSSQQDVHEHIENGHTTTFDILTRAANTLTHPTTWASNVFNLVASAALATADLQHTFIETSSEQSPPQATMKVPDVTCITAPMLTLTESNGTSDTTMTRRLSLAELSQPPYAPWPPRESRAVLCANAAACASRMIAQGEPDPFRFSLPWVMDKRFMFPLPLDHQGRASFRSGRWWSRRNLGYEHVRPAPVQFIMRKKAAVLPQEALSPTALEAKLALHGQSHTGDDTLPLTFLRHPSILSVREAALAMARAGHQQSVPERKASLLANEEDEPVLHPVFLRPQTASDDSFAHVTDSDSDVDMDLTEEDVRSTRAQQPRRAYSAKRLPPLRGRTSSLKQRVESGDDYRQDDTLTSEPAAAPSSPVCSPQRRLFAQRWQRGNFTSPSDTRAHDSDDSDDSLGHSESGDLGRYEHSSDTSEESDSSDELDGEMKKVLAGYGRKYGGCQLLGTVLEDAVSDDQDLQEREALRSGSLLRDASFFLANDDEPITVEPALGERLELVAPRHLLERTQALEIIHARLKMPHLHTAACDSSMPGHLASACADKGSVPPAPASVPFAAAVLARPIPTMQMPGLLGAGGPLRRPSKSASPRAQPRTVFFDASSIMDWETVSQ